jgi:Flp pilus assembly protein TadD
MNADSNSDAPTATDATVQALNIQGYQCLAAGQLEEAVTLFQQALALAPRQAVILNNLGNALFNLQRHGEAVAVYQQAIAAQPNYPKPYSNLALLYQIQGKTLDAIAIYQQYLTLVPDDGQAHHNLGVLYMTQKRTVAATAAFEAAAAHLSPDTPELATNLGIGYFFRGDRAQAIEYFEQASAMDAAYLPAQYHLGIAALYAGQLSTAIAALESVVAAQPDYPQAAKNLQLAREMVAGRP